MAKYGDVPTILMGYVEDYVNNLGLVAETASEVGASSVLFPDLLFEHLDMLETYVNVMRDYSLRPRSSSQAIRRIG